MAEYVTPPNIHTVLKKYQTTAPKSLQGPGHALASTSAGCMSVGNCSLDGSINGGAGLVGGVAEMHSLVGIRSSPCELTKSEHCSLNTNPCLQTSTHPALPLIKKEILTSPEPAPLAVQSQHPAPTAAAPHTLHNIPEGISPAGATATTLPPSIKIMPPPPPEVSQPILSSADSGWGELYETRLEGKSICCFLLGGELRLCLPQFLNNVLGNFSLEQINRSFDELGIFCSQCTPDQLMEFKAAKILPSDVKSSGLITRTDAERLCAALLHRSDRNSYINVEDIPKGAISFKVYHHCFGKCEGICTPDMYSYTKPTCIMCLECKGWFSPQKFVGHVHRKVENRTCHWGFDSRYWHDYLHVALDVENREKYQKILDELKEVEIKEQQKTQHEINYLKRKADMNVESAIIVPSLSLPPPPPHQPLAANVVKHRSEQPDIPNTKKPKNLDEAIAYQLEYQHYQSLMYAHCAQQQRVAAAAASSAMSAFRPWPQPKGFHHAYNAVTAAALSTLPYLSQDPPVLQNPERVVRCSDRERFERTYQPNVALAPRKSISSQEHHELREREKERLERERDMDRMRDFERERTRERERQFEREKDLQRKQQQHQHQQQQKHLQAQSHNPEMGNTSIIQIKQERAPTPDDMSSTPPPRLEQNHTDEGQRNSADILHEAAIPMISPLILSHKQPPPPPPPPPPPLPSSHHHSQLDMQQQITRRHTRSSSSSSSGNSSTPPHPALHLINPPHKLSGNNGGSGGGGGGGGSVVIDNQKSQTQSAQRNPLPMVIPHLQQQQQQQQYMRQSLSPSVNCNNNNNTNTNNSPCNNMRSPEEFGGSNEITSSTSPVLPPNQHHNQPLPLHNNAQNVITTVNHHRKLLPSSSSAGSYGANNNHCELTGRIRISRNLINQNNILRSPTPPLPLTIPAAALQQQHISHHAANNQQQQQQQQKYEFFKQKQKHYHSNSHHYIHLQQHHPNPTQLSVNMMNPNQQNVQHQLQSPSPTLSSSNDTGLNLSTSASAAPHNTKSHLRASTRNYAHTLNPHHVQHNNKSTLINSEFELSTDTDEDSIHDGEADSSNTMTPWEMAIEALRDARPKDRERLLNMLQRILNENQHYRLQNQQLKELLELRNDQINKLNSDLQHCRRQLEPLKLNHISRHSNGYIVKQVLKNAEGNMLLRGGPPEKSELRDEENYERMSKAADNGAANVTAAPKESPKGGEYHQNNWEMSELYRQTVGKEEDNVHLKRIKREINDSMDDTEMVNAQELEKDIQPPMDNTQRQQREDETSATESEQEPEERSSQTTNNHHNRSLKDKLDNGNESNTFLNQKTDETSDAEEREEDDDEEEEEEEEEDGRNSLNHIQAPHSQAISQPPTATTPLSPDSAATAGQLFDSSNSSDASSMRKAQMCASDALAKINSQVTEMEDEDEEGNDDDDDDDDDDNDDDDDDDDDVKVEEHKISIINNKFAADNESSNSNRGEPPEQKDMAGSCPEDYDQKQNGQRKCYGEKTTVYTNDTQASIKQISFPPTVNASKSKPITTVVLATKASKKQTPTTNNDIQIKQEYL